MNEHRYVRETVAPRCPPVRKSSVAGWRILARAALLITAALPGVVQAGQETAAVERRLADDVRYLASDELEGRGIGTKGLDLAAEYIADRFAKTGLNIAIVQRGPYQTFQVATRARVGDDNRLALVGPAPRQGGPAERIELKLGEGFTPLAMSASGRFDLPLAFVGYGITGKEEGYDDYRGIEVDGKAVVIFRHEPEQDDPNSAFNGTQASQHAPFTRKAANADDHGAAAVIFCTDQFEIVRNVRQAHTRWQAAIDKLAEQHARFKQVKAPTLDQIDGQRRRIEELTEEVENQSRRLQEAYDPILPFSAGGIGSPPQDFPVIFCRRAPLDRVFQDALKTDLAALEHEIDDGPTPHSRPLTGWRAIGEVEVERDGANVKNVVGVLEGEGPLADETLVIGAHYDHLGKGRGGEAIYNGADDNASGVAVMLEVARTLAQRPRKLRRRVVFIAFSAEERGLLGSSYYVEHPLFDLQETVAMLNLDCVGRLRDERLHVGGAGSATQFGPLLDELNGRYGFDLAKQPSGYGPSDHASFYRRKIPVMHFFTGRHSDLHRPSDDFETLSVPGMRRIAAMVAEVAVRLANAEQRPRYVSVGRSERGIRAFAAVLGKVAAAWAPAGGEKRPFFGSLPDFEHTGPGYAIRGVTEGGPAEQAGLRGGDVIVRLGESRIGSLDDFTSALGKHHAGDRVRIVVQRSGRERVFEVTLAPPR
jgi:hypothetical protein